MYVCMYVCMYVYIYIYIYMYVYIARGAVGGPLARAEASRALRARCDSEGGMIRI